MSLTYKVGELKKCRYCGKTFASKSKTNLYCCRECYVKQKSEDAKAYKRQRKSNSQKIIDIAQEAKAHGMSYGKYVAFLEMQKNKGEI